MALLSRAVVTVVVVVVVVTVTAITYFAISCIDGEFVSCLWIQGVISLALAIDRPMAINHLNLYRRNVNLSLKSIDL
jgi:hypothetical protein